jgi:pimeloyl-ACP methyl ester carboxylesterase
VRLLNSPRRHPAGSSTPESGYLADRLGDDVLAVIDALKLDHPVLVGHSLAGQELSSIGSRHPEKAAGLIYLDAVNIYSFYQAGNRNALNVDFYELQRKLEKLRNGEVNQYQLLQDLLEVELPLFKKDLEREQEEQSKPRSWQLVQDSRKRTFRHSGKSGSRLLNAARPRQNLLFCRMQHTLFPIEEDVLREMNAFIGWIE